MKTLIIFDSNFGNTKIVAETLRDAFGQEARALSVSEFKETELSGVNLLIVGSPIHGWRPSEKMNDFLVRLNKDELKGIRAAAFDTRATIFFHGDAAHKISKQLKEAGAEIISEPRGFIVIGREGPLKDGELEKAMAWAEEIKERIS